MSKQAKRKVVKRKKRKQAAKKNTSLLGKAMRGEAW